MTMMSREFFNAPQQSQGIVLVIKCACAEIIITLISFISRELFTYLYIYIMLVKVYHIVMTQLEKRRLHRNKYYRNWRKKNPEKARKYIRNYMRKWRLLKKNK